MPKGVYERNELHQLQLIRARSFFTEESRKKLSNSLKGRTSWNKGKKGCYKLSEETKRKMSEIKKGIRPKNSYGWKGKNHPRWKGGYSRNINGNWKSRLWRHKIYERDNYTCQECGTRSSKDKQVYLEAHHIKSWARFPKERYKLLNGITLCKECHKLTDNYKGKNNR